MKTSVLTSIVILFLSIGCQTDQKKTNSSVANFKQLKELEDAKSASKKKNKERVILDSLWKFYKVGVEAKWRKNHVTYIRFKEIHTEGSWEKIARLIDQLPHLRELSMISDQVTSLPFQNLHQLDTLEIFSKGLSESDTLVLPSCLQNLKALWLNETKIKHLIFSGTHLPLRDFKVYNKFLDDLSASFAQLTQLEELTIGGNQTQAFTFRYPHLKKLTLGTPQLRVFEPFAPQLEELYLVTNQLKKLEVELPRLKRLRLGGNIVKDSIAIRKRYPQVVIKFDP